MIIESPQKGAQSSPRVSTRTKPKEDAENVRYDIQFALAEVKSVRKKTPHFGFPQLTVTLTSNELMPTLHFHGGHMKEFWTYLQRFLCFEKFDECTIEFLDRPFLFLIGVSTMRLCFLLLNPLMPYDNPCRAFTAMKTFLRVLCV